MSADHRKPVVAFIVLAFLAAALVGVQRADAQAGRFLAGVLGSEVHAQGQVPLIAAARGPAPGSLPDSFTLVAGEPAVTSVPEAVTPHAPADGVSRAHVRGALAPAVHGRPPRSQASGATGPADHAAEQARVAASKPLPAHAVARGHRAAAGPRRSEGSRTPR